MIYDTWENFAGDLSEVIPALKPLKSLFPALRDKSFEELKSADFSPLYLRFVEYETKPAEEILFEAHIKYWDLQIVVEGEEYIGYAPLETLTESVPYDEKNDIAFYCGDGLDFKLCRGVAVLLAPWDAHRPGAIVGDTSSNIKKVVVKLPW